MKKYNYTPKKDRDKEDLPERKTQWQYQKH
jgi:hypothetical protein